MTTTICDELGEFRSMTDLVLVREVTQERAQAYLKQLLGISSPSDERVPQGVWEIVSRAKWPAEPLIKVLHDYIKTPLGDDHALLVIAQTDFAKRGADSAGVQMQYDPATEPKGSAKAVSFWRT